MIKPNLMNPAKNQIASKLNILLPNIFSKYHVFYNFFCEEFYILIYFIYTTMHFGHIFNALKFYSIFTKHCFLADHRKKRYFGFINITIFMDFVFKLIKMFIEVQFLLTRCIDKIIGYEFKCLETLIFNLSSKIDTNKYYWDQYSFQIYMDWFFLLYTYSL